MKIKEEPTFANKYPHYIPVPHWDKYHDWPTIAALRNYIFNKKTNGFDKVVLKLGKRVLINEAAFFDWVANQGKGE
ncbi:TPA: hypothetical protein JBA76_15810 [Legionella pneumophila subsp. pneumophila]|uniref:hypothetical protein n=1 Tax=Legionella pneumophila TaxID=446 RepID=UPI00077099C2|nr:hypothetical protein [Legionella pneumophila]HAT8850754.1 hypothetical protein [Legionella pneumophila subsp. pneumophila]CZI81468.1 Uncharacterised protein [Legionella pneumophila]CZI83315.1 Uncharacterised protein [Legionella pneumophila]HAT9170700.1 hypothetical protein [Legionella pneumophila subsp. pneumophila]HDP0036721.1 hypothetical protein [Legionella pneumophila]